jgi:small conductance mechanosensitive channel
VRLKRRETAAAFIAAAVRYVVFLVAAFAVVGIFASSPLTVLGGASLVVILVGFALQRFLMDVVAGTLALVENQYGVGDFIAVEPTGFSGIVEEFGLRTTVIRGLNGDRLIVPNSQITAVRRSPRGYRTYHVELLTHDPDQTAHAVEAVAGHAPAGAAHFLRAPRVVERRELGDGVWLVRAEAAVAPTLEWLAEDFLPQAIARRAGDSLVGEPIVYTLDAAALRRYQARVLVR